jgi:hypothetical protein
MANYRAIANGNWSDLLIWEDDSLGYFSASSVLPTSSDDVYANGFTVTIDGVRNANTIRNTAFVPSVYLVNMSIPAMTSNNTPSGVAIASGVGANTNFNQIWFAYDRITTRGWQSNVTNTGWIGYNFPSPKIIKRYGFFTNTTNAGNFRSWTFEGSNDGTTWTVINTQTNFTTVISTFYSFDVSSNTTPYTFYRINVTAVQTAGQVPAVIEVEMSEDANLYGGTTPGGFFKFDNNSNFTISDSIGIYPGPTLTTPLQFDLPSGQTANLNCNLNTPISTFANVSSILYSGLGILNIIGSLNMNLSAGSVGGRQILFIQSNGVINILGSVFCSNLQTNGIRTINVNSNCILNITGDVSGGVANTTSSSLAILGSTSFSLNITGNVTTNNSPSISLNSGGIYNHIGDIIGGNTYPAILNTTSPATIDILGTTTSGVGAPAIQGLATTFVKVRGNVVNTGTYYAIFAGRVVIDDNVTSWQFKDSTNTITRTLYTAGVNLGNPTQNDVRNGVTYGPSLELTGTTFVPSAANVRRGVPVDNTVGTADLTANDIFYAIETSNIDVAVRLRNIATVETTGIQIASYNT